MIPKIISIINMKGGVGKTTIAVNLSYALYKFYNKQILLVDIDPQFNATQYLIKTKDYIDYIKNKNNKTMYHILEEPVLEGPSIVEESDHRLTETPPNKDNVIIKYEDLEDAYYHLIPSELKLIKIRPDFGSENRLSNFLKTIKGDYDYIFIDCPPTMSFFTISAFVASDAYIIPLKPDYLSRMGLPLLASTIKQFESKYRKIKQLGIIFNYVRTNYSMDNDVIANVREDDNYECFDTIILARTDLAKLVSENTLVYNTNKTKEIADSFINLASEFLNIVGDKI